MTSPTLTPMSPSQYVYIDTTGHPSTPTTSAAVGLATAGTIIYCAFRGDSGDHLWLGKFDVNKGWQNIQEVKVEDQNIPLDNDPSVTVLNGDIYIACQTKDSTDMVVVRFDGAEWDYIAAPKIGDKTLKTSAGPNLAVINNSLALAFKGESTDYIYVATYEVGEQAWVDEWEVHHDGHHAATTNGPKMVFANGTLYLAYHSQDDDSILVLEQQPKLSQNSVSLHNDWDDINPPSEWQVFDSPAIGFDSGLLYLAYTGTDGSMHFSTYDTASQSWEDDNSTPQSSGFSTTGIAFSGQFYVMYVEPDSTIWMQTLGAQNASNVTGKELKWQNSASGVVGSSHIIAGDVINGYCLLPIGSAINVFDQLNGSKVYSKVFNFDPQLVTALLPSVMLLAASDELYTYNPAEDIVTEFAHPGGYIIWLNVVQATVFVGTQSGVFSYDLEGNLLGKADYSDRTVDAAPTMVGDTIFIAVNSTTNTVFALNTTDFSERWHYHYGGQVTADLSCDGANLYFGLESSDNSIVSLNVVDGSLNWQSIIDYPLTTSIAANDQFVFAGIQSNIVLILNIADGSEAGTIDINTEPRLGMWINNGLLYFLDENTVYAYEIDNGNLIDFSAGSWPTILGFSGDTLYATGVENSSTNLYSLSFLQDLHEFRVDSQLMQDFTYSSDDEPVLEPNPIYHTQLTLLDPTQIPLGYQDVKVWASTPCTITVAGIDYDIDSTQSATVASDSNGGVRIELIVASIVAPDLLIWAPFMLPDERIVIYPSTSVQQDLSQLDGNELAAATDYNGDKIVDPAYDQQSLDDAADAIQSISTFTGNSQSSNGQKIQYLDSNANDSGAFYINDQQQLNPQYNLEKTLQVSFDPDNKVVRTKHLTKVETEEWRKTKKSSAPTDENSIWDLIKSGEAELTAITVEATDGFVDSLDSAITYYIDGVENAVDLVIDTVEKSVILIEGFFNTLVGDVNKVLEWLSFVFDWKAILTQQKIIKGNLESAATMLKDTPLLESSLEYIDNILNNLKEKVDGSFDELRRSLGEGSFNDYQYKAPSVSNSQTQNLGQGSKQNWFSQKMTSSAFPQNSGADAEFRHTFAQSSTIWQPNAELLQSLEDLLSKLESTLSDDIRSTFNQIIQGFSTDSGSNFLNQSGAAFLTVVEGVFDIMVDIIKDVMDEGLACFKTTIDQGDMFNFLQESEIPIPYLQDLYQLITGTDDSLTVLEITSLAAAIQSQFVDSLVDPKTGKQLSIDSNTEGAIIYCCTAFWAIGDAAIEAFAEDTEYSNNMCALFGIGFPLMLQLANGHNILTNENGDQQQADFLAWVVLNLVPIVDIASVFIGKSTPPTAGRDKLVSLGQLSRFKYLGQLFLFVIGVMELIVVALVTLGPLKLDSKTKYILLNVLPTIPLLIKSLRNVESEYFDGPRVIAVVDGLLNFVSSSMGIYWDATADDKQSTETARQ